MLASRICVPARANLVRGERLDRRLRADRHEGGRLHHAAGEFQASRAARRSPDRAPPDESRTPQMKSVLSFRPSPADPQPDVRPSGRHGSGCARFIDEGKACLPAGVPLHAFRRAGELTPSRPHPGNSIQRARKNLGRQSRRRRVVCVSRREDENVLARRYHKVHRQTCSPGGFSGGSRAHRLSIYLPGPAEAVEAFHVFLESLSLRRGVWVLGTEFIRPRALPGFRSPSAVAFERRSRPLPGALPSGPTLPTRLESAEQAGFTECPLPASRPAFRSRPSASLVGKEVMERHPHQNGLARDAAAGGVRGRVCAGRERRTVQVLLPEPAATGTNLPLKEVRSCTSLHPQSRFCFFSPRRPLFPRISPRATWTWSRPRRSAV